MRIHIDKRSVSACTGGGGSSQCLEPLALKGQSIHVQVPQSQGRIYRATHRAEYILQHIRQVRQHWKANRSMCRSSSSSLLSLQVLAGPWALSWVIQESMSLKYETASGQGQEVHVEGGQVRQKRPQSQEGPPGLWETKVWEPSSSILYYSRA